MSKESVLFDYVLVISLENNNGTPKPFVSYRFPPAETVDTLAAAIEQFCFPEADQWCDNKAIKKRQKESRSETFNFVLTESDGSRKFGYCRRLIVEDGKGKLIPECFCILSLVPSGSLFRELLNIVEELRHKSSSAVFSFLKTVLAKSFPKPGETLSIRTFDGPTFQLRRSDNDFLLDFVSFTSLFKNTTVAQILDIFAALLTESRIIVCSKSVSTLSDCVNALSALLYPFTWQHVFIPILPKALVSYCAAPMPFLVGVLASNLSELNTYPMEEAVLLDVDSGKYLKDLPPTCDAKAILPPEPLEKLKKGIKDALKKDGGTRAKDLSIAQAFLDFMYTSFGSYQKYFQGQFNRELFLQEQPPDVQQFLKQVAETQMYEMFIKEREAMSKNGTLELCVLNKGKYKAISSKTIDAIENSVSSGSRSCKKCGIDFLPSDMVEKNNKIYCKGCYADKKLQTKGKFRSFLTHLPSSTKTGGDQEKMSKSAPSLQHSSRKKEEGEKEESKIKLLSRASVKSMRSMKDYLKKDQSEKGDGSTKGDASTTNEPKPSPSKPTAPSSRSQSQVESDTSSRPGPPALPPMPSKLAPMKAASSKAPPTSRGSLHSSTKDLIDTFNLNHPPNTDRTRAATKEESAKKFCSHCGNLLRQGKCTSCVMVRPATTRD